MEPQNLDYQTLEKILELSPRGKRLKTLETIAKNAEETWRDLRASDPDFDYQNEDLKEKWLSAREHFKKEKDFIYETIDRFWLFLNCK